MIPSVNFHLWEPCNMRCKFCFATFQDVKHSILPKGHLPREQAIEVVLQLAEIGFEKITFAGGEPTLCPWLSDLIRTAKEAGMITMIVTNGSKLSDKFLEENKAILDWIAVSVDSLNDDTNLSTGRGICGKSPLSKDYYYSLMERIKHYGYGLKINTVVNSKNFNENMSELIQYAKPRRWKVLQALPIDGQNDLHIHDFAITNEQFHRFLNTHKEVENVTNIVPETNNQIKGSYAMVDPAGRFFDNSKGKHTYSRPILEIGSRLAIQQVNFDYMKFVERGGVYDMKVAKRDEVNRITISGEVASGKSTIGKLLAIELGYSFTSIGQITRELADQNGTSIVEFQKECLGDSEKDKLIDSDFSDKCNGDKNLVIDYRLGFKFIDKGFHIFLKITETTAIERLKSSSRYNETYETLKERNDVFKRQFQNAYAVDYCNEANYDLVINVEDYASPEAIVKHIIKTLNENQGK